MKKLFAVRIARKKGKLVFDLPPLGFSLLYHTERPESEKKRRRHCVLFIEAMVKDKMIKCLSTRSEKGKTFI
jgi:hypothetical protein